MGGTAAVVFHWHPRREYPGFASQMWAEEGASNIKIWSLAVHPKETDKWMAPGPDEPPQFGAGGGSLHLHGKSSWADREPGTLRGSPED